MALMSGTASGSRSGSTPVVSRRISSAARPGSRPSSRQTPTNGGLRPLPQAPGIRKSIESCVSTGSQADFFDPRQTIILFDWDDTLCPSTWIQRNRRDLGVFRVGVAAQKHQRQLLDLQKQVDALLRLAMTMGKVIIVTNATEPWVAFSCKTFLPQLIGLVSSLPVIYARSVFETQACESAANDRSRMRSASSGNLGLPALTPNGRSMGKMGSAAQLQDLQNAPQRWKEAAFLKEISGFYSRYDHQSWKNIISIGDSVFERDAARRVVSQRPMGSQKCRLKTAKLLDEPSLEELIVQVKLIQNTLRVMVQSDSNLDIELDEEDLGISP